VLKTFRKGGIHPEENKITSGKPITDLPIPPVVIMPVLQHIGTPATVLVKKGERVKTGQMIASGEGFISANIHSSVTGTVTRIDKFTDASGYKRMAVEIESTVDEWIEETDLTQDLVTEMSISIPEITVRIWDMGVVGMGGATFPTHVKMAFPKGKKVECLIINGAECEPYITADHRLMLEKGEEILIGIRIIMNALGTDKAVVGVENNKADAIENLRKLSGRYPGINIQGLKVKYPQGSEKHLVKSITGREVPSGGLPVDVGTVIFNIGTMFAVYEAVQKNKPLISRIVTVSGKSLKNPSNFRVRIGTPVSELIKAAGGLPENADKIIAGGPMMGKSLNTLEVPVTKGMSGLLVLDEFESKRKPVQNCIRCSRCVSVCPMGIEPYLIMAMVEKEKCEFLDDCHINDCMECGSCSYICPANRPLLDYIRLGKVRLKKRKQVLKEAE
jgi:electron transport complex protein RnfC